MKQDLFNYYKNALSDGLCAEYKGRWAACHNDKEQLVRLVMAQQSLPHFITYCSQKKGLSKKYILDNFSDYINGKYVGVDVDGVRGNYKTELYIGENGILKPVGDVLCAMWATTPQIILPRYKAVKIYCGCSSKIHLSCDGYNSLVLMLFDDSEIVIDDADCDTMILAYKYSPQAKVTIGDYCFAPVKEFTKELKL